jgi:uncharacterized protein YdaU (DUF1376 family)
MADYIFENKESSMKNDKMSWFPFYYNDWKNDTSHLTQKQRGAYHDCIVTYYATRKPLPADLDMLYRMVSSQTDEDHACTRFALEHFFILEDGVYHHKRIDAELAEASERVAKRQNAAHIRWDKSRQPTNREAAKMFDEATPKPWQPRKFNQAEAEQITDEELINLRHCATHLQAQRRPDAQPGDIPAICFTDTDGKQVVQAEPPSPEQLAHIVAQIRAGNNRALGFGFLSPRADA